MTEVERMPLLGVLAGQREFRGMGERLATIALARVLQCAPLRESALELLSDAAAQDLSGVVRFLPEFAAHKGARPDIVGVDSDGRPLLIVEMKFGAQITPDQVLRYRRFQVGQLGCGSGATILLVPERRITDAGRALDIASEALLRDGPSVATGPWDGLALVPWQEWLTWWDTAFRALPHGPGSTLDDARQFRAMCWSLLDSVVDPLGHAVSGPSWSDRREDILHLPELVAARLNANLWWEGFERLKGAERTYPFLSRCSFDIERHLRLVRMEVGVRPDLAEHGKTPLWLRFNEYSDGFEALCMPLKASAYGTGLRMDRGHVWLPLELPPSAANDALLDAVVQQVLAILRIVDMLE
jgi:hypothetical protein